MFDRNRAQFAAAFISAQTFDTAKASYDAARTGLEVAARAVEVAEARLALAQRNLDDTVVRAPFAGIVTVKAAQEGEMVSPMSAGGGFTRTGIGTIVDMSSLEVEVDVSENFINRVVPQQPATVTLNAYPDWSIPARVIAIIPTADRAKATVKVRVGFDVGDPRVLPEMGARVPMDTGSPMVPAACSDDGVTQAGGCARAPTATYPAPGSSAAGALSTGMASRRTMATSRPPHTAQLPAGSESSGPSSPASRPGIPLASLPSCAASTRRSRARVHPT